MGTIADKRLGDFLPTFDAYRPVALTITAILLLVLVVPGAGGDSPASPAEFSSSPANVTATTGAPTTTAAPASSPPATAVTPDLADETGVQSSPPPPPTSPPTTSAPSTASPPTTAAFSASTGDIGSEDAEPEPLRITESGWATAGPGAPLAGTPADDVPEDTLPVGTRVGQHDKISFIRLSGDDATLVLAEDASGRRGTSFETSPVEVCQITDAGWEPGEAQSMDQAPEYDADNCVAAQQQADGTWSISLFLFDDPTDQRGFALVPSADAPLDFQVTFASQTVT